MYKDIYSLVCLISLFSVSVAVCVLTSCLFLSLLPVKFYLSNIIHLENLTKASNNQYCVRKQTKRNTHCPLIKTVRNLSDLHASRKTGSLTIKFAIQLLNSEEFWKHLEYNFGVSYAQFLTRLLYLVLLKIISFFLKTR